MINFYNWLQIESHRDHDFILNKENPKKYSDILSAIESLESRLADLSSIQFIATKLENSVELIALYLLSLKHHKTFIPFAKDTSVETIKEILPKTSGFFFTSDAPHSKKLQPERLSAPPQEQTLPSNLALILFTSGSTDKPKGVMISHENLIANTESICDYLDISEQDRQLLILPLSYSFGLSVLNSHLKKGASLVLNNRFSHPETIVEDINHYECTTMSGVPSHYYYLCKRSSFLQADLPSLTKITQAGGHLSSQYKQKIIDHHPDKKLFIMYGATEATARLSFVPPADIAHNLDSIGKPIPGVEFKIIPTSENSEEGKLLAKGKNIFQGYFNDNDQTKKYLQDGWLVTGDLAKRQDNGYYQIIGREKDIIKSYGYRVSAKEIEHAVSSAFSTDLLEVSVCGVLSKRSNEDIYLFYSTQDKNPIDDKIKAFCSGSLVNYKQPAKIIFLPDIPKTNNGKVDKVKLKSYANR